MRFTRRERYQPIDFNQRRQAAFARKQQREQARYPLFGEHIQAEQHDATEEITRRQRRADRLERTMRELDARHWRHGRRMYFAQPETVRAVIRARWEAWVGPTSPTYYIYVVESVTGEGERRSAAARAAYQAIVEARPAPHVQTPMRLRLA